MFGSNFAANFGIPDFGYQGADPQGGFFGANAPQQGMTAAPDASPSPAPGPNPGIGAAPPLGANPLAPGALAPGAGISPQPPDQPAAAPPPAAGIGSPFGKPGL